MIILLLNFLNDYTFDFIFRVGTNLYSMGTNKIFHGIKIVTKLYSFNNNNDNNNCIKNKI